MNESWKQYPKGKSASVDAFRQRMQNMMDLQRALEEKYFEFTEMYLDNRDQGQYAPNASIFEAFLHNPIAGLGSALADCKRKATPKFCQRPTRMTPLAMAISLKWSGNCACKNSRSPKR